MQYGVLSDIHGSLTALIAVWQKLERDGLDGRTVLNAGDNVGYGDQPEDCVRFLQAHPQIVTVQGNYDKNIARFPEKEAEYRKKWVRLRPDKFEAIQRDSAAISEDTRGWLLTLPKEQTVTLEETRIVLTHYSPGGKEGLGRWTSDVRLQEIAEGLDAEVVICGHTHTPFVRRVGGVLFVNPGTVGRSFFGGPRYAVLTLEPGLPPHAALKEV